MKRTKNILLFLCSFGLLCIVNSCDIPTMFYDDGSDDTDLQHQLTKSSSTSGSGTVTFYTTVDPTVWRPIEIQWDGKTIGTLTMMYNNGGGPVCGEKNLNNPGAITVTDTVGPHVFYAYGYNRNDYRLTIYWYDTLMVKGGKCQLKPLVQ
jgi:hypothetical protein